MVVHRPRATRATCTLAPVNGSIPRSLRNPYLGPIRIKLFSDEHCKRRPNTLTHVGFRDSDGASTIWIDLEEHGWSEGLALFARRCGRCGARHCREASEGEARADPTNDLDE